MAGNYVNIKGIIKASSFGSQATQILFYNQIFESVSKESFSPLLEVRGKFA